MTESEVRTTPEQLERSSTQYALAYLLVFVFAIQLLGLVLVHTHVLLQVDGPSTFETVQYAWFGGLALLVPLIVGVLRSDRRDGS